MRKFKKQDLRDILYTFVGTNTDAQVVVDLYLSGLSFLVARGDKVRVAKCLQGNSVFHTRVKAPRPGRNPKTGKAHTIESMVQIAFTKASGQKLNASDLVNVMCNLPDEVYDYITCENENYIITRNNLLAYRTEPDSLFRTYMNILVREMERIWRMLSYGEATAEIRMFGSFAPVTRPERIGRNPKSGERVVIPEKTLGHFKPSKELKDYANKLQLNK